MGRPRNIDKPVMARPWRSVSLADAVFRVGDQIKFPWTGPPIDGLWDGDTRMFRTRFIGTFVSSVLLADGTSRAVTVQITESNDPVYQYGDTTVVTVSLDADDEVLVCRAASGNTLTPPEFRTVVLHEAVRMCNRSHVCATKIGPLLAHLQECGIVPKDFDPSEPNDKKYRNARSRVQNILRESGNFEYSDRGIVRLREPSFQAHREALETGGGVLVSPSKVRRAFHLAAEAFLVLLTAFSPIGMKNEEDL